MSGKAKLRAIIDQIEMLTTEEKELIVDRVVVNRFEKGTVLLREGQISPQCYLVLEGCIREYSLKDGEEKTTAFYTEGEGTAQYIGRGKDQPSDHYLECLEDCDLMVATESMEDQIRQLVPRLDLLIQEVAKQRLEHYRTAMNAFIHSSPEERYVQLMETKPFLFHRVPHHQIASYLGMKPQSLSRIRRRVVEKEQAK